MTVYVDDNGHTWHCWLYLSGCPITDQLEHLKAHTQLHLLLAKCCSKQSSAMIHQILAQLSLKAKLISHAYTHPHYITEVRRRHTYHVKFCDIDPVQRLYMYMYNCRLSLKYYASQLQLRQQWYTF